jgi:hypothetical protein
MILRVNLTEMMDRWLFEAVCLPELPGHMPELVGRRWTEVRGFLTPVEALHVVQQECSSLQETICTRG